MEINRSNYEQFFIDFLEGNLVEGDEALRSFLKQNPDLEAEFNLLKELEGFSVEPIEQEKHNFEFLKKPASYRISDEVMVAALEGDLGQEDKLDFERSLAIYPENKKDFALFQLTKLPFENIQFTNKQELKKEKAVVVPLFYKILSIASILALISFASFLVYNFQENSHSKSEAFIQRKPEGNTRKLAIESPKIIGMQAKVDNLEYKTERSEESLIRNSEVELREIESKSYQAVLNTNKAIEPFKPNRIEIAQPNPPINIAVFEPKYQNPAEWLLGQLKSKLPESAIAYADTILQMKLDEPAENALTLIQKTTGITYQNKKDEETGLKSFSIVSKYFAYERINHL